MATNYGNEIEQVINFKYLGLMLDQTLSFNAHIEYLMKKVTKNLPYVCNG